jgi:4-hydroxy-3-methylbut-2-enyl diphosphate reductase
VNDRRWNEVLLAEPRGFCAGVDRAIEIVERACKRFGAPIYVRHEIVHNTYVVNDLKAKGAIFIEDLAEVPPGATLVFSAHGVSQGGARAEAARAASRSSTPPARWSPRCTWKWPSWPRKATSSS